MSLHLSKCHIVGNHMSWLIYAIKMMYHFSHASMIKYSTVSNGLPLYTEKSQAFYRGSYMSAHVLLNLLNELGKRDKMRGLPSILPIFRNEFNKFNYTRARMIDSIYHMTDTLRSHFWRKNVIILLLCTQRCYGRHNVSRKSINH